MLNQSFTIKKVDKSCADAVSSVFRSIYGDEYPMDYVYHGDRIMDEITSCRLVSSLALDSEGIPVGYVALYTSAPNPRLWEGGNLIVIPGRSDNDLAWALLQHYLRPENLPSSGSDGIFGEAVCHHYFSQLGCSKAGFADCAIALDQMDCASFREHRPNTERVACLLQFYEQSDPVSECYLPEQYFEFLQELFGSLRHRTLLPGSATLPVKGDTERLYKWFDAARMCRVSVSSIGGDWGAFLNELLDQAHQREVISLQVVLSAGMPYTSAAVEQMQQRGFFISGIFPRWFGADGIMMQQVIGREPDYDGIKLYGSKAKELLTFIRKDRETVLALRRR